MLVECRPYQYGTMIVVPKAKAIRKVLATFVGYDSSGTVGLFQQSENSQMFWYDMMSAAKKADYDSGWDVTIRVDDTLFWLTVNEFLSGDS